MDHLMWLLVFETSFIVALIGLFFFHLEELVIIVLSTTCVSTLRRPPKLLLSSPPSHIISKAVLNYGVAQVRQSG